MGKIVSLLLISINDNLKISHETAFSFSIYLVLLSRYLSFKAVN